MSANSTAASEAASQASIAESSKASGGGGMCFITTAVCDSLKLPDDNFILTKLRAFRDSYMMETDARKALVKCYYDTAPAFVERINQRPDAARIYGKMYSLFILPAVNAIDSGDAPEAFALYRALVEYTQVKADEF